MKLFSKVILLVTFGLYSCQSRPLPMSKINAGISLRHVTEEIKLELELVKCIKCERTWNGEANFFVYEALIEEQDSIGSIKIKIKRGSEKDFEFATNTRKFLPIHIDQLCDDDCTNFVDTFFVMKVDSLAFSVISGCDRIAVFCPLNDKVDLWIDVVGSNHLEYVKNLIKTVKVYE